MKSLVGTGSRSTPFYSHQRRWPVRPVARGREDDGSRASAHREHAAPPVAGRHIRIRDVSERLARMSYPFVCRSLHGVTEPTLRHHGHHADQGGGTEPRPMTLTCDGVYLYTYEVTLKKPYNVKLDLDLLEAIRAIKVSEGIPESEQIRRGIRLWLESKGVMKADRKRAVTRKRP